MRRGITFYLMLLLAVFGVLSSTLAGYASYLKSRELLVRAAENELTGANQALGRKLSVALGEIARDARMIARHPLAATICSSTRPVAAAEGAMADIVTATLSVHPEYFQIRVIEADRHGLERVRIDRIESEKNALQRVQEADLQEKGHFPYVFRTLKLGRDEVYLSRILINHERGAHAALGQPTIQVATPVIDGGENAVGVVVINVDLNSLFNLLKTDLPAQTSLYLANRWGDFLLHPDPGRAFVFDVGGRELVQDEFPATATLVNGDGEKVIVRGSDRGRGHGAGRVVGSFQRVPLDRSDGESFLLLGLSKPTAVVTAEADTLAWTTLYIVIGASVLALVTAIGVASTVTHPLRQMARAVRRFSRRREITQLPTGRYDEIGVLARNFHDMQLQIQSQMKELHARHEELEHLARHDPLTGLPNRMMFFERLEQSLARSRRSGLPLALLYVDLDRFKEVNDTCGHSAGDAVLKATSLRLLRNVREIDTVARLGGDEFVILIDSVMELDHVPQIAEKLLTTVVEPIEFEGHRLTIEASIGISVFPTHGQSANDLLVRADRAMYRAKSAGRNNYSLSEVEPE
ncbi:MAG TPA: sensor domain-containing diguanylate cyclase [Aromatoleum sp.]|uniref:sensor domain-containing diguanylate cyclase n=1 Tax=Aromatoleum sp. TaxID=2307007 RepID=UPI002B45DC95|nr:sensor domain-containing diguanylate cyclase [Aromatoleum sp.]HJV28733.1 sensor domain-containing diguanylate cyclase [Aromatoleum sp.]